MGVSIEDWNVFLRRWEVFRTGSNIDEASSPSQLFQCAGAELGDSLLIAINPNIASESLSQLLTAMRSLAVIPVATCVLRTELLQLRQERGEAIRAFAARVRGKAETCAFAAQCECGKSVNYTDNVIRDVSLDQTRGTGDERHPQQADKRYCCSCRRQGNGTQRLPVLHTICCVDIPEPAKHSHCHSPTPS